MNKTLKITLLILSVFLIVAFVSASFLIKNVQQDKKINNSCEDIDKIVEEFEFTTNRAEKINILKTLKSEYENYCLESETFDEVSKKYETEITNMKNYFISDYDLTLEENTIIAENISDKSRIEAAKSNLESLLETIKTESEIVLDNDENKVSDYETAINDLIVSYNSRIEELNEIEKEKEEATTEEVTTEEVTEATTEETIENTTEEYVEPTTQDTTEAPYVEPTTEATTQAPTPSGHTCASASSPASNFLECINHGAWWRSTTNNSSGQTFYFDQYGWAYDSNGIYLGYNIYTNPDIQG